MSEIGFNVPEILELQRQASNTKEGEWIKIDPEFVNRLTMLALAGKVVVAAENSRSILDSAAELVDIARHTTDGSWSLTKEDAAEVIARSAASLSSKNATEVRRRAVEWHEEQLRTLLPKERRKGLKEARSAVKTALAHSRAYDRPRDEAVAAIDAIISELERAHGK